MKQYQSSVIQTNFSSASLLKVLPLSAKFNEQSTNLIRCNYKESEGVKEQTNHTSNFEPQIQQHIEENHQNQEINDHSIFFNDVKQFWKSAKRNLPISNQENAKAQLDKSPKYAKTEDHFLMNVGKNSQREELQDMPSSTIPKSFATKQDKIKINLEDQEQTRKGRKAKNFLKAAINCQIKKQAAVALNQQRQKQSRAEMKKANNNRVTSEDEVTQNIKIPASKQVEKILQGESLRKRFSGLLKDDQKYKIGYEHSKLLHILKNIDSTIEFVAMNKKIRNYFYADLRRNIYQSNRTQLSKKQIQQLIFLDQDLFSIQWEMNQKINQYDLLITLPSYPSEDQRVQKVRKSIVKYLLAMQVQYLGENDRQIQKEGGWVDGFDPNKYEIPAKDLPIHPFAKDAEIRALSNSRIESIQNNKLRELMMAKKEESVAKSRCSDEVVSMIFGKKSNGNIKQKLFQALREKQAIQALNASSQLIIDKTMLVNVCQQILLTYESKRVSNLFKATLIQILNKRLSYQINEIISSVETIVQVKEVVFLKEVTSRDKTVILQINKSKFNEMMNYLKSKQAN